jgi:PHD/YefM family antitoxin component YafN of YafNO toxin-antitoxin module
MTRNYKQIFQKVKTKGTRVIVMNDKTPEVVIVNLRDFETLKQTEKKTGAQTLLSLAGIFPKNSGLPKDLSTNHDAYAWD